MAKNSLTILFFFMVFLHLSCRKKGDHLVYIIEPWKNSTIEFITRNYSTKIDSTFCLPEVPEAYVKKLRFWDRIDDFFQFRQETIHLIKNEKSLNKKRELVIYERYIQYEKNPFLFEKSIYIQLDQRRWIKVFRPADSIQLVRLGDEENPFPDINLIPQKISVSVETISQEHLNSWFTEDSDSINSSLTGICHIGYASFISKIRGIDSGNIRVKTLSGILFNQFGNKPFAPSSLISTPQSSTIPTFHANPVDTSSTPRK